MPLKITHTLDGGIFVLASGILKAKELIEMNQAIYETKDKIKSIKYQINDFTGISDIIYDDADIDIIARQDKRAYDINPDMLIAVICKQDLIFGLSRMWEAKSLMPFSNTSVFRKVEDAYIWISERLKKSLTVHDSGRS